MASLTEDQLLGIAKTLRGLADTLDPPVVPVPPVVIPPVVVPPVVTPPTPTPPVTPPTPVPDSRFALVLDEQFTSGKLDPKSWWAPYDGVKGTGNVGMRKGSLCTFRNGNLIIAAERPSNTSTDYNTWFSTGVAAGPIAQTYGRWECG